MADAQLTWGDVKKIMEELKLSDETEIWVEIREFDQPGDDIPKSAVSGVVHAITKLTKLSGPRVIFKHDR